MIDCDLYKLLAYSFGHGFQSVDNGVELWLILAAEKRNTGSFGRYFVRRNVMSNTIHPEPTITPIKVPVDYSRRILRSFLRI